MTPEERELDKKILIQILVDMEDRLRLVVFEPSGRPSKFRLEFVKLLPGPWDDVAAHFQRARGMIKDDELNWQYVEGLGLSGRWLKWKKQMFDETLKEGVLGRFLIVANSILGSLSKAIPPLELVNEYKEHVEAAMKYVRAGR
jgi:hypothetical protein